MTPDRSWWGWGTTDHALSDEECMARGAALPGLPDRPRHVPDLADVVLPTSRVTAPDGLPVSTDHDDRARHDRPERPNAGDDGPPPQREVLVVVAGPRRECPPRQPAQDEPRPLRVVERAPRERPAEEPRDGRLPDAERAVEQDDHWTFREG